MNIFVATWYYPPVTSSEGIVTYKLLRKSRHHYDVFSSLSQNWSYHTDFGNYEEPNISTYTVDTDDIDVWVEACIEKFEELHAVRHYDCLMTRSTPPESVQIGLRIKEKYPDIKWVASLADPLANNPYEIKAYVQDNPLLMGHQKRALIEALKKPAEDALKSFEKRSEKGIKLLCKLKKWEMQTISKADLVICPTARQLSYLNGDGGWRSNYFALPHSYCTDFYRSEESQAQARDRIVFTYTGYSDDMRSLQPFVEAVNLLKRAGSPVIDSLLFRFVGNTPRKIADMVLNFDLQQQIRVENPVSYFESLAIMKESDWLLHVDANFEELEPGGSIFFAGKIADYLGAGRPVLALTGEGTPACRIVEKAGGVVLPSEDVIRIADTIESICMGRIQPTLNAEYIERYDAVNVAARFDEKMEQLCAGGDYKPQISQTEAPASQDEKLLTVCVPSYNVQRCLDRCLYTLTSCEYTPYMDIIVVDDGSSDHTIDIAREYERLFPGIVRAVHKENGGHGSTINVAMDLAKGTYFRVVDSDDWIDSNEMDKVLARVKEGALNTDIISANYHIVDLEEGTSFPIEQECEVEYDKPLALSEIDTKDAYFTMAGIMIKTEVLRQAGMKLQENTFFVDVEFILFPIPYVHTVTFVDAYIYKYSRGSTEQSVYIPNLVRRYDHHERVMKRVIEYRVNTPMDEAQEEYFDSILKRVLHTHYGLCTVYDKNKREAYKKIGEFDHFLQETYPQMAAWVGSTMPVIRAARKSDFDYDKIKRSFGNLLIVSKQHAKGVVLANRQIASKLIKNKYTYRIATSRYFTQGKGAAFKNKVYRALIKQ